MLKFRLLCCSAVLLLLLGGCVMSPAAMAQLQQANEDYSISPNFDFSRQWRVAVLPPTSTVTNRAPTVLYDHAGLSLMKVANISVVDRSIVDQLLQEQAFNYSGTVDPTTAVSLGKLAGASAVAVTTVTQLAHDNFFSDNPEQRDAQLYLKIISVETGEVLYYAVGKGSSFDGADQAVTGAFELAVAPLKRKAGGQ
jgi:curli biogenesis system outer membrane secretion channel CsgG